MQYIEIAGHLGADPETRFTANNHKVTNLRIAVNTRNKGKEETLWWSVSIWDDRFAKLIPHLKKGSAVIVWGELTPPEIYSDREGKQRVRLSINAEMIRFSPFGGGKSERPSSDSHQQHGHESHSASSELNALFGDIAESNDDLPF